MIWYKWLALFVTACVGLPALGKFLVGFSHRMNNKPPEHNMATQLVILATLGLMLGMVFRGVEW